MKFERLLYMISTENYSYKCSTCEEVHYGLPLSWGPEYPAAVFDVPEAQQDERIEISSDQCIIDGERFFVRGRIEIPVLDSDEKFYWLVWLSVSEESFERMSELWETEGRENEPPYFGWLQSELPVYAESTLNLAANIHTQSVGTRPSVKLEPMDHPLAKEQRNGISLLRVQEIAEKCMHS